MAGGLRQSVAAVMIILGIVVLFNPFATVAAGYAVYRCGLCI